MEYLEIINQNGIQKNKQRRSAPPWLLYLGGGQGSGKTTLLRKLQSNNIIGKETVIVNSRLFFDSLFQDVPYAHKVQLWPYFSEEKKHLTLLITKIAMAHQIPLVVDTHILFSDFCKELTDSAKEFGGNTVMVALYNPLDICYFQEQTSAESHLEESNRLVYEQLMFHKLFAINWSDFVSNFDTTFLIDQNADQIIFQSGKQGRFSSSLDRIKQFLDLSCIDPDELANDLALVDLEQGTEIIRQCLQRITSDKTWELIPKDTEVSKIDSEIMKSIETALEGDYE